MTNYTNPGYYSYYYFTVNILSLCDSVFYNVSVSPPRITLTYFLGDVTQFDLNPYFTKSDVNTDC